MHGSFGEKHAAHTRCSFLSITLFKTRQIDYPSSHYHYLNMANNNNSDLMDLFPLEAIEGVKKKLDNEQHNIQKRRSALQRTYDDTGNDCLTRWNKR